MSTRTASQATFLPYGRQEITQTDIDAVVAVLRSDWLTQGPTIQRFEKCLTEQLGAKEAAACATGTAALHLAMLALGIGEGDIVVTSPNTFLASANCARYVGAEVAFADIDPATGLMDPNCLETVFRNDREHKIKAVIPVHFAGQPADLEIIHTLARNHGAAVVDDACHALGASYTHDGLTIRIGASPHADMTCFSFHPVKHVATGEGGAVLTNDSRLAEQLRLFRNHGMQKENLRDPERGLSADGDLNPWYYEMQIPGFNYRITDMQAALGITQISRLDASLIRRRQIADLYRHLIGSRLPEGVTPLTQLPDRQHAYHLFTVLVDFEHYGVGRAAVMNRLRERSIGTQVHYIPVPSQPYFRARYGFSYDDFPNAERYYAKALSLPMYPGLTDENVVYVVDTLRATLRGEV
jgi:UDP-4-amino-4,6-dideoxy-N-acetyl-beta-L-altrosamine transaminase